LAEPGPRQPPDVALRSRLLATVAACTAGPACAPAAPSAIDAIVAPAVLRVGSPIQVRGRGLAGARLRLTDAPADVTWTKVEADSEGVQVAVGHIPESPAWRAGQRFGGACLIGTAFEGWQPCAAIDSRFRADWQAGATSWTPAPLAWGATLTVYAEDLLLPGEGAQWIEIDQGTAVRSAPLWTALLAGRGVGGLTVAPDWTGALPGDRVLRLRIAGQHRGHGSVGPWTPWHAAPLVAPKITVQPPQFSRGAAIPLTITGLGPQAHLSWAGAWRGADGQLRAQWAPGPELPFDGPVAVLRSDWYAAHVAALVALGASRFEGSVAVGVRAHGETWSSALIGVDWPLRPVQRVRLFGGPGLDAALHRLGLGAAAPHVRASLLDRLRSLFAGYAVEIDWHSPQMPPGEWLHLHLQDRDPNGLGLLGAEAGAVKDDGNLVLDERLGGLNPGARRAGLAGYGGVFVGELMGFSKALNPGAALADPAFDAALGPWCPQLGGRPVAPGHIGQAAAAIQLVSLLIAEVAAHEIGHALGLAAGTAASHHQGDHPGWIMDAGPARPFRERAGLPGAAASQWGAIDAAYLAAILPP